MDNKTQGTRLFVGSLSWNTTEDSLKDFFSQIGEVAEAKVITDRETGRSRGFGFVEYTNVDDANKAIAELDGKELDGRTIKVNMAEQKTDRGDRDNNRNFSRNNDKY